MSRPIYLTKRYHLNCSHIIKACADGNEETSKETSFHGHSLELFITIKNDVNPESGLIVQRDFMDETIQQAVLKKYDRKNLNTVIAIPTGENILKSIHQDLLKSKLKGLYFQSQLKETSKNMFSSPKVES